MSEKKVKSVKLQGAPAKNKVRRVRGKKHGRRWAEKLMGSIIDHSRPIVPRS